MREEKGRRKVLFLHGFTSSGDCEIARTLRAGVADVAEVVAPDLPMHPGEAMEMLEELCVRGEFDMIVGSSCGAFYGQQLVRFAKAGAVLISPFFYMTEFLKPRIGRHEYKSPRADGVQFFEVTEQLVAEFAAMERRQFDHYDEADRDRVIGMFGRRDTLAHFRDVFLRYYDRAIDYDGPHTMTAANVRTALTPVVLRALAE